MSHKSLGNIHKNTSHDKNIGADFDKLLRAVAEDKDRESFILLFQHFAPRIKSFLMKGGASPEQADELAQETMLTVWQKASGFNPARAAASTWIFTIARNKRVDSLRKNARIPEISMPEFLPIEDDALTPREKLSQNEDSEIIARALEQLPDEQAALIQKSFFEGKSHGDIARETGIPLGTIKSRIRLALERLRHDLHKGDVR